MRQILRTPTGRLVFKNKAAANGFQRAAEALAEEQEQESHLDAFRGEPRNLKWWSAHPNPIEPWGFKTEYFVTGRTARP